ncbi:MAG TPA: hypothetical protein VFS77_22215 [Pyrinomonadaceae bacterium]|nr:hypothetical protein [Pyrinomonadaceae bacterium]
MTVQELARIMGCGLAAAQRWLPHLDATMQAYEIDSPERQAAFLAQVGHESMSLLYTEEIASGKAYEGRKDLGNTQPGDGRRFKGHGLIQLTGRANHEKYAQYKGMTLDAVLTYLQTEEGAADVAGWFWMTRDLNELADADAFEALSVRINGRNRKTGLPNGYEDRVTRWERAKEVLA